MIYTCMNCGHEQQASPLTIQCQCGAALWVKPESRFKKSSLITGDFSMWRYSSAYSLQRDDVKVSFGEGMTPLASAEIAGISILAKMDSQMPSGSFKDRGAAMVVNYLNQLGIKNIAEDSSGNGGSAYAAYAAKANMNCYIFVPKGTSLGKTVQTRAYGAHCIEVEGDREDVALAAKQSVDTHNCSYVGHNWHPMFIEGVKSIAYETWEQCGYQAPDNFVAPAGNGSLLAGAYLGFSELLEAGEIDKMPRLFGIQTEGIQPFVQTFNHSPIKIQDIATVAEGIKIKRSSRLDEIVAFVRESNGMFISVDDQQTIQSLKNMAKQGFFIEPTSATAFAGIEKLVKLGEISAEHKTVGVVTGNGLKATSTIQTLLG
ncbi:threonine synthase [Vibrio marisflavi]|uniref:Threonine synthase n=1 Tax=Vibrio marisflavi CECT 7928 TaxID=634439 RepID=A0ABM8ZZ35_9VIBR|nr:threonine synthase [Vibrio marisflavi]CAH0536261.1 Threonine synthase [Vibrio marisflavi CECT 7928]